MGTAQSKTLTSLKSKVILTILMVIGLGTQISYAQDDVPFQFVRIGDRDGIGMGEGSNQGYVSEYGTPLNRDGMGMLYDGDYMPDLNGDGVVDANGDQVYFNEQDDSKYKAVGAIVNHTSGARFTDYSIAYGTPMTFEFDFKVKKGMVDMSANIYFNLISGDLDHDAQLKYYNENELVGSIDYAWAGKDDVNGNGDVKALYYEIKAKDVFVRTENGYHIAKVKVVYESVTDPMYYFDFFELGVTKINPDLIIKPGPAIIETSNLQITAGDTVDLIAQVTDVDYQIWKTAKKDFNWRIISDNKQDGDEFIVNANGKTSFTATRAHRTVKMRVKYIDPDNSKTVLRDTISVKIVPAPPYGLDFEQTKKRASKWDYHEELSISYELDAANDSLFAFVRDVYGNFIENAVDAQWSISDDAVVSISPYGDIAHGRYVVLGESGSATIAVSSEDLESDVVSIDVIGDEPEPDTTNLHVVIIDTTLIETTITKSISTLALEIEDDHGKKGTSVVTLTAGDFESNTRSVTGYILLPNELIIEITLSLSDDSGIYSGSRNIYDELREYENTDVMLQAWFIDSYGDSTYTDLEIHVLPRITFEIGTGELKTGLVNSFINFPRDVSDVEALYTERASRNSSHFIGYMEIDGALQELKEEDGKATTIPSKGVDAEDLLGPTLEVGFSTPDIVSNYDSDEYDGVEPVWYVNISIEGGMYDHQGQYITSINKTFVLDADLITDSQEEITLYFEWQPKSINGELALTAENGRQLQSGVFLGLIQSTVNFELLEDEVDMKKGFTDMQTLNNVVRFGYLRKE